MHPCVQFGTAVQYLLKHNTTATVVFQYLHGWFKMIEAYSVLLFGLLLIWWIVSIIQWISAISFSQHRQSIIVTTLVIFMTTRKLDCFVLIPQSWLPTHLPTVRTSQHSLSSLSFHFSSGRSPEATNTSRIKTFITQVMFIFIHRN